MRRVIGRRDNGIGCHSRACRLPGSEQRSAGRWRVRLGPPAPAPRPSAGRTAGFSLRGRKVGAAGTWGRQSTVSDGANAWLAELVDKEDSTRAAIIGTSANFLGLGL